MTETDMKTGVELIAEERQRQLDVEGWTVAHDDEHADESIASAAACYAMPYHSRKLYQSRHVKYGWYPRWWPATWDLSWWKPSPDNRIKELVKAGALIAAEIDRLTRAEHNP